MNVQRGNTEIHIPIKLETPTTTKIPKEIKNNVKNIVGSKITNVWKFYLEDINRIIFPFKVGLAVILVSLLILLPATFQYFGVNNLIWAIITTAIMFEYTVGSTFSKGFNRAIGSILAAVLAIGISQLAQFTGTIAQPILIGGSIFFIGTVTTFMKTWPSLVQYEYVFRVTLFTFCLIIVSAYHLGNHMKIAKNRLYSVAIGGLIAILVNVLILPAWAGDELHKGLVDRFHMVADALEECAKRYQEFDGSNNTNSLTPTLDEFQEEPALTRLRNSLVSSNKFQTLANYAKWEPPHGRFKQFSYPWFQYVKIDNNLKHCAFDIMALHGVLHSEFQAPYNLRLLIKQEIIDVTNKATNLLRALGEDIRNMKRNLQTSAQLLKQLHNSVDQLQWAINQHSYITIKPNIFQKSKFEPKWHAYNHVAQNDLKMINKIYRRLHSCPSIEVNIDPKGCDYNVDAKEIYKMRMLENNALLYVASFSSLLIELVAKLGHLVETVDELSKKAKFNQNAINPLIT